MLGQTDSTLVEKLAAGEHPIEVCARSNEKDRLADLIRAIGFNLVHVTFPNTIGGTELGLHLQRELCDPLDIVADGSQNPETLKIVGDLTLDWVPIRVTATISLKDFTGVAVVEKRAAA